MLQRNNDIFQLWHNSIKVVGDPEPVETGTATLRSRIPIALSA
jgi:hypothetical protein